MVSRISSQDMDSLPSIMKWMGFQIVPFSHPNRSQILSRSLRFFFTVWYLQVDISYIVQIYTEVFEILDIANIVDISVALIYLNI